MRDASVEDAVEDRFKDRTMCIDRTVYIKLPNGDDGKREIANIGTLTNGAGLAMNTVDALADAGGRAANFPVYR